jgi:putative ATP-dependent endonuclease of OLD family
MTCLRSVGRRGRLRSKHTEIGLHLSRLNIENFRIFGSGEDALDLEFGPGLTMLVGPNDGGKTAVVDAIRFTVGTTARDTNRLVEDDFHYDASGQATSLRIVCRFDFADPAESAPFFEHLTPEEIGPALYLVFTAMRQPDQPKRTVVTDVRSGPDGNGPRPDGTMRALMASTYLRALRDALDELTAGRGSRLSQILYAHPEYAAERIDDFNPDDVAADGTVTMPKTLKGTMHLAEHGIEQNRAVGWTRDQLNTVPRPAFARGPHNPRRSRDHTCRRAARHPRKTGRLAKPVDSGCRLGSHKPKSVTGV